jgi:hypothetical protein
MSQSLKFIQTYFWSIGIVVVNVFYFIPKTIEWLKWESGITMGYVGIELTFNYVIHIFFIYACVSLICATNKNYSLLLLVSLMILSFLSFFFAFRIISFAVFIFLLLYLFLFYRLFKQISQNYSQPSRLQFRNINFVGFFISAVWLVLDCKYF